MFKDIIQRIENQGFSVGGVRRTVDLGENFDGSRSTLPPYVDINGVQVHPSRVDSWTKEHPEEKC